MSLRRFLVACAAALAASMSASYAGPCSHEIGRMLAEIDAKLERLRRGLQGQAEVRPTSARWAWVEYQLAQGGPAAGLRALDAHRAGGTFAAWRKAFANAPAARALRVVD